MLNGGCAELTPVGMRRDGEAITITVINTVPAPSEPVMCTMQIGYEVTIVDIGEIAIGQTVKFKINSTIYTLTDGDFELFETN